MSKSSRKTFVTNASLTMYVLVLPKILYYNTTSKTYFQVHWQPPTLAGSLRIVAKTPLITFISKIVYNKREQETENKQKYTYKIIHVPTAAIRKGVECQISLVGSMRGR